jgi:hypothetical protein
LDRILEIEDYMADQEDMMIKFKYEHYLEYRFPPIKDRKPTPFVQNVQNVVTTSIQQASPPSPEFSPTRESFA